jgi:hypothetical protein
MLLLAATTLAVAASSPASYRVIATVPLIVDGQVLRTFTFDPVANRLYAGSDRGLFWIDLTEPQPRLKGPMFKHDIIKIEMAPDVGRLFFLTKEEAWSADVRQGGAPVMLAEVRAYDLAYEPVRKEVYVAPRQAVLWAFDAKTGERGPDVALPGWLGRGLEAVPGRVFLDVEGQPDLHVLDSSTRRVQPWKVKGRFIPPAYLDADPKGRYLFAAFYRDIVAIDIASAAVVGHLVKPTPPAIAYDPGAGLLIAVWNEDPGGGVFDTRLGVYRVEASGFVEVARLPNPPLGGVGVEPTSHGFIQQARYSLVVWGWKAP